MTDTMTTGTAPDVQVKVILKERETEAWIKIDPPVAVDPAVVLKALADDGVVFGIDDGAVVAAATTPGDEAVRVALGEPPHAGEPAVIEYFFRRGALNPGRPLEMADGRVDHRELGNIENVNKGQVLATRTPPGLGIPGKNVKGEELPARNGKDLVLRAGQNVQLSDDGLHVTALIDGQPKVDGARISVQPVIVVQGDVDFATGNITFQGTVKVGGNVLPGFTIKATQDVEIGGMVEGASIEAGGRVTVKGGVRMHAVITAHADVTMRFVDSESSITTRANVVVVESAMHSTLTAGLAIKVGHKLIGGTAQAGEFISAEEIGAMAGTHTVLDVRTGRQTKVIEQLGRAIGTLEGQLLTVDQTYQAIIANPSAPSGAFEKTREIKTQLETRLDQLREELAARTGESGTPTLRNPFIAAQKGFQPGVQVHFDTTFYHVNTPLPAQRISESNGQIAIA